MISEIGIMFAFAALLFWGFGDFLIQKSTRKLGDWETLFTIVAFGAIVLTPFVYNDLHMLYESRNMLVLLLASSVIIVAALLNFEALKKGKIAVVEPVFALEVPVSAILAFSIMNESIGGLELILTTLIIGGLILVSLRSHHFSRKAWIEKGVVLAMLGSFLWAR